jgi:hypothetical protein
MAAEESGPRGNLGNAGKRAPTGDATSEASLRLIETHNNPCLLAALPGEAGGRGRAFCAPRRQ